MKIFDVVGFTKHYQANTEKYMAYTLGVLSKINPNWLDKIKNDKDLFNEDGSVKVLPKEEVDKKVAAILDSSDWNKQDVDMEVVYELFVVDKALLDKFIVE